MFDESDAALQSVADIVDALRAGEAEVAGVRARQVRRLRGLSRRGVDLSPGELAGRLDVSVATARALVEAARRTPERSDAMT